MLLTTADYTRKVSEVGFEEFPFAIHGGEKPMASFIDFTTATVDLRFHICKVILRRCFSATYGDLVFIKDYNWFISQFLSMFDSDIIKPGLTVTIKEAFRMISADDPFNKGIIATTFMFSVIEFYVKYELGFRPDDYDFFDKTKKEYFKKLLDEKEKNLQELSLGKAIKLLQRENSEIAEALQEFDRNNIQRLEETGVDRSRRWIYPEIADRLNLFRNTMLHGENHSFYSAGHFLLVLYALFHLYNLKKGSVINPIS